ncbi:LytR C-terminal domain-containing protein [Candidatus Roizmanbacteria bacterium]|nr:LytR C-terminal domain-containing protein [Candidatus Roizmanbacteria bacterium]
MPAKHVTKTRKTTRRRLTVKKQVEQTTVIPDTPVQPVQPLPLSQSAQPTQPPISSTTGQSQSTQPAQPVVASPGQPQSQPVQAQPVQQQPVPVQSASVSFEDPAPPTSEVEEAEIKMGTESSGVVPEQSKSTATTPDNASENDPPAQLNENNKKNLLLPIIFIVLLGVAILVGLFIFRQSFTSKEEKVSVVTLSPSPVKEPTPEPVDLSKYTINVLNGSETDGAASNLKSDLEGVGFDVPSIGNADASNYTETIIQAKEDVDKEYLAKLRDVLEESFELGDTEELDEDAETDVVIIIGSKAAE